MSDRPGDGTGAAGERGVTRIDDEALDWAIRMAGPQADWDAFLTWLEGDVARSGRYDMAAAALLDADEAIARAPTEIATREAAHAAPAMPPQPRLGGSMRWLGGAAAAMLTVGVGITLWKELPRPYAVQTPDGQQRSIDIGDGSSIVLAGGSKVTLDHTDARIAAVDRGQVLFRVRHDGQNPFRVTVGALRLTDLGTTFDVKAGSRTVVGVAEGAVRVESAHEDMRLGPGQSVVADDGELRRVQLDPADVGGWRDGRLAYDEATLSEVAADLERQFGWPVTVEPALAKRTFRGTLELSNFRDKPALLGELLGVSVKPTADGWALERAP
jgi:transmembrane sensor